MKHNRRESFAAAQALVPKVKTTTGVQSNVLGSQVNMGLFLGVVPSLPSITYELDNSADAVNPKDYIIGDPTGMIAAVKGSGSNPDKVAGIANRVAPNKSFFFGVRIVFSSINYQTSSTANQFNQTFQHLTVNVIGNIADTDIVAGAAQRNTAQNDKLLTLDGSWLIDINRALFITVLPSEIVTLIATPTLYTEK